MIDISIINYNNVAYSIKSSIFLRDDNIAVLKIINMYEVRMESATSYQKIRTIFESSMDDQKFNTTKYNGIFEKLVNKLSKKYKLSHIYI